MEKDFAMLFVIDKWLLATKEMTAECRGWYLNLILHQYDKSDLPDDVEELANLADVRFSEFNKFQQVWQHVLQQKFNKQPNGRLTNAFADQILKSRETFKTKRSDAGKWSSIMKKARVISKKKGFLDYVKDTFDLNTCSTDVQHMLEHLFQLYINENRDINKDIVEKVKKDVPTIDQFLDYAFEQLPTVDPEAVKMKYKAWVQNEWQTMGDKPRPIINWKSTLLNTLPHLSKKSNHGRIQTFNKSKLEPSTSGPGKF